jgi:hypothetical protein
MTLSTTHSMDTARKILILAACFVGLFPCPCNTQCGPPAGLPFQFVHLVGSAWESFSQIASAVRVVVLDNLREGVLVLRSSNQHTTAACG